MKNTDTLMQELREDIAQRMKTLHAREQEMAARAQAAAEAEAKMAAAVAANDEKAHHEAEGALSFAKSRIASLEGVDPWWTPEEAGALIQSMFDTTSHERKILLEEVNSLVSAAVERLQEVNRLSNVGELYQASITKHVPLSHSWGFGRATEAMQALQSMLTALRNRHGLPILPTHEVCVKKANVE